MSIELVEVVTKSDLKQFIKFPMKLYKGVEEYVPPLLTFELSTLDKAQNPAFDHCEARYWLAKKEGKLVGRVAAIIVDSELKEKRLARFGWIDFIDDPEVSKELLDVVTNWSASKGAEGIHGPLGFTDLDFEGALIEGFDQMATQATIYNHPYYKKHYELHGLAKAVDWVEYRGEVPEDIPERLKRVAKITEQRSNLRIIDFKNTRQLKSYKDDFFNLLNKLYHQLYGYHELTPKQIDYFTNLYFDMVRKEFVIMVVDENNKVVGMALSFPSISRALKKAKGSMLPFGFVHLLRDFYFSEDLDIFLIGVFPEYSSTGISAYILNDLFQKCKKHGIKRYATGPMLEQNASVLNLLRQFESERIAEIRRRCYIKSFT